MEEQNVNEQEVQQEETKKVHKPFKRYIGIFIAIVAISAIAYFVYESLTYQSTDDAYIETTTVQVAPRVSGQITEVYITDNQKINEGDKIAKIDPVDYEVALAQADAKYERILLNQKNAQANFKASQTNIDVAKKDLDRYKNLYADGAVSKQTLDVAQAKYDAAVADRTRSEQALLSSGDGKKVADADLKEAKASRDKAELNLSYTNVKAPQSGTISSRRVEKGMFVNVGTPLCVIVPNNVWVVANFKENQLRKMKVGQEVEIKVDTYPDHKFKGKIDSIQRASGAKSSLFPPENAVGSFVKIVQRIPVKIVFTEDIDPNEFNLVPGMSVVPKVRIK